MKKSFCILVVLVLIASLTLADPRPVHAAQSIQTHYNVTLTNGSVVYCGRIVYELNGRLECIFASGYVTHYEASDYRNVAFVVEVRGTP